MRLLLIFSLFVVQYFCVPPLPLHSFEKRVLRAKGNTSESAGTSSKKVFVTFKQGCYTFKKKRVKANRITFNCNGCDKLNHYLPVMAWRERVDSDEENDIYTLDGDTLPSADEHVCAAHGMESLVRRFRQTLMDDIRADPTRPFPALYLEVRFALNIA